jgi:hypothetical protein
MISLPASKSECNRALIIKALFEFQQENLENTLENNLDKNLEKNQKKNYYKKYF